MVDIPIISATHLMEMISKKPDQYLLMLEMSLLKGADPNQKLDPSLTPLCTAIQCRDSAAIKMLIDWGADKSLPATFLEKGVLIEVSPISMAFSTQDPSLIQLIETYEGPPDKNINKIVDIPIGKRWEQFRQRFCSLAVACAMMDVPRVKKLLADGADPNLLNDSYKESRVAYMTPLMSCTGTVDIMRLLLEAGADPNGISVFHDDWGKFESCNILHALREEIGTGNSKLKTMLSISRIIY